MPHEDALTPDDPELDISSLIDVCFFLLIFFLVTSTIQQRYIDVLNCLAGAGIRDVAIQD
ncbi:MAG: biopolymer transporter ExbD [Verrucomicrobiae bacterium]|nr:biopolymer transporter ExbD [Verrucomicrobiae bacterium]NNJ43582.1 hypothetical protein [Akkermansiaceae bacterium]